jgi:hypothetical protein
VRSASGLSVVWNADQHKPFAMLEQVYVVSDGITIDLGSAYPFLEESVLSLFGKDASSKEWFKTLQKLIRTSAAESAYIQCVGMPKPIPIDELYQPTQLIRLSGRGEEEQIGFDDLVRERSDAIIFAGAGWGKTTLLHWIYQRMVKSEDVVPLLFTLRRPDVIDTLEVFIAQLESGRHLKKRKTALVLVDGYDEIDRERRIRVSGVLERYRALKLGPFFLTCRPYYDIYDLSAQHCRLASFSESDALRFINSFAKAYGAPLDDRMLLDELLDHGLDEFADHPLMLALVCILKTGPNSSIPRSAIALIRRAIDTLTFRWDEAKGIKRTSDLPLDGEERVRCLMRIAFDMKTLHGSWLQVEKSIQRHILLLQVKGIDRRVLLQEIMQWYGLIVPAGDDAYQFVHRSIHEFLAARFWVENGTFGNKDPDEWDTRAAYATCLVPDGTTQLQKMLRSGTAAFVPFFECLYNNALFEMEPVAAGVVERTARRGYSLKEEQPGTNVSVTEDFFSVAKDDFLRVLTKVGCACGTAAGDAVAFCALSELFRRRKLLPPDLLSKALKARWREQPKLPITAQRQTRLTGEREPVSFRLTDVIGCPPVLEVDERIAKASRKRSVSGLI